MNDHNLDDLIIDTIAPKNNKTKSFLTTVALLIVVLIVAIILTKTLLKSPDDTSLVFEENLSEMIAPELKLQENPEEKVAVAKPKEESSLSTLIEEKILATKKDRKPEVVEEISPPTITKVEKIIPPKKVEVVKVAPEPVVKETPIQKVPTKSKVEIKKTTPPVKAPVVKQKVPKPTVTDRYYVQVGSFKENPSPRFLSVIKSSGFRYLVSKPDRLGNKKLLIGPYKTRKEVDKAREVVRDRIHKSAFVVKK